MEENSIEYSILITTKNRLHDLLYTLSKIKIIFEREDTECIIYDDGSDEGIFEVVKNTFPKIRLLRNETTKGYIYCRNRLLNLTKAKYAISLDDDAHFVTENVLESITIHFNQNPQCGLLALRIFWGMEIPYETETKSSITRVKGVVGCGHVWRMEAWKSVPNYSSWFIFYGEENFASLQLFKKGWEIHYLPQILVHHRVNLISRKGNADYQLRQRRSIRAGWYLYFMFYPLHIIPRKLLYTFWMQLKNKTFKGDWKATFGIFQAIFDVMLNLPKLIMQSNRLTRKEHIIYSKLTAVKLYWKPEDEK